jgi:hypothetical protein
MKAIQKVLKKYPQFFYCLQEVQYSLKRVGSIEPCEMTFLIHCLEHTKLRRSKQHGCCGEANSMAAPLSVCTKEELRLVVHFLWEDHVKMC